MSCEQFSTDHDFAQAIRSGGTRTEYASDCLYRRDHRTVVKYMENYVGYQSGQLKDIRDLVQDAFIIMIKKIRFGGYNEGALVHFWTGIAKGLLRNKSKRDSRMDLVEDSSVFESTDYDTPENWFIQEEMKEMVHQLLGLIGDRCRNILLLWAGGYSMEEIAEKTGLSSEAMARKTKFKCKKKLIESLRDRHLEI